MKKLLRVLLALALCVSFAVPTLADRPWEESDGDMAWIPGMSELPTTPASPSEGGAPVTVSEAPAGDTIPDIPGGTAGLPDTVSEVPGGSTGMFTGVPEFPDGSADVPVDVSDIPGGTAQLPDTALDTTAADDTSFYPGIPGITETPDSPTVTAPGSGEYETPVTPASSTGFLDVPSGHYYEPAVQWSVAIGISEGVDDYYFAPEQTCSVAEILTFLWRAKGSPEPMNYNSLNWLDDPSLYYYKPMLWAHSIGLIENTGSEPGSPCTRAMAVTYLWKLDGAKQVGNSGFTDVLLNADYAQAVAWATRYNITDGTSVTQFSPNQTCTRGQIMTFLYRNFALQ